MNDKADNLSLETWKRPSKAQMARYEARQAAERLAQTRLPITDVHRAFVFLAEHPVRGYGDSSRTRQSATRQARSGWKAVRAYLSPMASSILAESLITIRPSTVAEPASSRP